MKKNILANIRVLAILMACLTVLGVGETWGGTYSKITSLSALTTGNYVIVGQKGSYSWGRFTYGSMSSGRVTYTEHYDSSLPSSITTTTANEIWALTVSGTGDSRTVTIYNSGQKVYLKSNGSSSSWESSSSTSYTVTYSSGFQFYVSTDDYLGVNSSANYWRDYGSSNLYSTYCITLYKEVTDPYTVTFNKQGGTFDDSSFDADNTLTEASAGAGVTLPAVSPSSACASEGWGFYGWATSAVGSSTTTAPTIVGKAGDTYHPTSSRPLYAVFAQGEYTKEMSAITAGGKYLIVANSGGDNYIMKYGNQKYGNYTGTPAAQINETFSGKYAAHAVNATWAYTLDKTSSSYYIRDNVNAAASNYVDFTISGHWYQNASGDVDPCTFSVSAGVWSIKSDYSSDDFYLGYDDEEDYAFFAFSSAQNILLYKAGTINYWSTPSCCDKAVTLSAGTKTNVSTIEFSETSVATCGDQASRSVTVTVTTNTGYEMTGDLAFTKSDGTATATKSTGPTGTGPYTYVYYFDQDDNGAGSFAATASAKSYTVTLNDNNGSGGSGSKSVTFNSNTNMTSAVAIPERTHYIFGGYWTSANSGATLDTKIIDTDGTWVASVSGYTDATPNWIKADNVTLYAKWTEHTYTNYRTTCSSTYDIVLDENGGDADGSAKVDANATKLKSISAPTKTGYKVAGYYAESGKTNLVAAIDGTLEEDVKISSADWTDGNGKWVKGSGATLYAGWTPISYEVRFNKNNASASGTMSNESYDYDESKALTTNAFSLTGYTFQGWATTSDGSVAHTDGKSVSNLSTTDGAVIDLYAVWTANKYTVTLANTNATSGSSQTVSATYDAAMPLKTTADGTPAVAALSRTGYTFNGWSYESTQYYSYDGSSISSAHNWDIADNKTLSPDWSVNSYTLTWSWDGGSTSSTTHTAAGSVAYETTLVYPDNATMSKTGYTFTGWSSTPSTMPAENTTITAQWSINSYNVAVLANSNVTITANTTIEEGRDDDVTYATTVTLNYDELGDGLTWGGWRVYKADDASTTVSVSGSGDGATFSMPAYNVKVEAIVYSVGIAWCEPDEITISGDVHLTSYKTVPVNTTSGAGNLNISCDDLGSATEVEVVYVNGSSQEVAATSSVFRLCNDGTSDYDVIDGEDLDVSGSRELNQNYSIQYTPNAFGQTDNWQLKLKFKKGSQVLKKTKEYNIYGRALPEEFVIASKYLGHWYALPNTMGTATETVTPIQITVDDATTPTEASYAPSTTVYKGAARKTETSNRNSIRLTNDGSHWLITNNSDAKLGLSATETEGYENREVWYLKSSTFGAYELAMDPAQSPTKKLGMYNGNMGVYTDPAYTSEDIYLLPIDTKYTPIDATATDWMQDIIGVTASTSATKMGIAKENGTEYAAVTLASEETSHVANFNGDIDFTGLTGEKLLLKWYDGSTLVGGSQVTVPSIILAGSNTSWSALETALGKPTTLDDIVVLSKPMTVGDAHAKAKQIVMDKSGDNTGKLTIQPNKGLEVIGTVKVYNGSAFGATGETDLVLESDEDGNASLVFENAGNAATVQQYSKASIIGNTWNWQYVGTPFTGSIPQYNYYGSWMYKWYNGGWDVVHGNDELTPFVGYCLTQESATTHVMGGTLVPTDQDEEDAPAFTLASGESTVIANSWTAPIYVGGFTASTFTFTPATIYLFNTGSAENGSSEYVSGDEAGTYVTIPVKAAEYTGNEFIAPMQGFFIKNTSGSKGTITLKYDELVRPSGVHTGIVAGPMKARKQDVNRPDVMKIRANGTQYSDRVVILAREDFSEGFDNGWDGEKMSFGSESPSVYVINEQGGYDAVSAIPSFEGTVVGFRAGADNNCTMSFEYDGDETLYLNDLQAQQSTLIDAAQTYTFTTSANDSEVRFIISATPITKITTGIENDANDANDANDGMMKVRKIIINDKLFIIRGGRMYSVDGAMIK